MRNLIFEADIRMFSDVPHSKIQFIVSLLMKDDCSGAIKGFDNLFFFGMRTKIEEYYVLCKTCNIHKTARDNIKSSKM